MYVELRDVSVCPLIDAPSDFYHLTFREDQRAIRFLGKVPGAHCLQPS